MASAYSAANAKNAVSDAQHRENLRVLKEFLQEEGNRTCADCQTKGPRWASVNLGVFMCLECAGVHRNMGVHISKVRSTDMDKWLPEQMLFIQAVGNTKANRYWEARYTGPKPRQCDKKFIEDKYIFKKYIDTSATAPVFENFAAGKLGPANLAVPAVAAPTAAPVAPVAAAAAAMDLLGLDASPTESTRSAPAATEKPSAHAHDWAAFHAPAPANHTSHAHHPPAEAHKGGNTVTENLDADWAPFEAPAAAHSHTKSVGNNSEADGFVASPAPHVPAGVAHRHTASLPQMPNAAGTPAKKPTTADILSLFDSTPQQPEFGTGAAAAAPGWGQPAPMHHPSPLGKGAGVGHMQGGMHGHGHAHGSGVHMSSPLGAGGMGGMGMGMGMGMGVGAGQSPMQPMGQGTANGAYHNQGANNSVRDHFQGLL